MPIWNLVLLKLCILSSWMLYLALVSFTSLNYVLITLGSSCSILCLFLARLKAILSISERVTKRLAQCFFTGSLPYTLNSLLAISATLYSRGGNPHELRLKIYQIIIYSLMHISLRQLEVVLVQKGTPFMHRLRIQCLILKALAAVQSLQNWLD